MTRRSSMAWLLKGALGVALTLPALTLPAFADSEAPATQPHRFAVIGHALRDGSTDGEHDKRFKEAFERTADPALEFVVAMGIKASDEPCTDALYTKRRDLFEDARRPLIVVPAASDWSDCVDGGGDGAGMQRMSRIRELFHGDSLSLGRKQVELSRLSVTAKYRRYAENALWEVGPVLYATINLPSNNNNYVGDAGRNNEFEDRWVANRYWLKRVFTHAQRSGAQAIVLFSEGDIKILAERRGLLARLRRQPTLAQDGYLQTRRLLTTLSQKFQGKVLLVDTAALPKGVKPALVWRDRMAHLSVGAEVVAVEVAPGSHPLFTLVPAKAPAKAKASDKPAKKK